MNKLYAVSLMILCSVFTNAQDYNLTMMHDGKARTFILHSPCSTYNCTGKKIPLVFAFHGLTETGTIIKNYSDLNAVADTAGFAVIYANGLSNRWNVGFTGTGASSEDDLGFANAMIDYMIANANNCDSNICAAIDTNRVYSCGMSNGGFFSYLLACKLSHRIAAIASVTGSMSIATYDSCSPSRAVPIFELHGTTDPIVAYGGSPQNGTKSIDDALAYWRNNNGCTGNATTISLPDVNTTDGSTVQSIHNNACNNSTEVLHYKITNGGHTWPSMTVAQYPEIIVGKTNKDVHASQEIWRFFNKHRLDNVATSISKHQVHSQYKFYPNPINAVLNIEVETVSVLRVSDVNGKIIATYELQTGSNQIQCENFSSGTYFARIEKNTGASINFRFVKE
jgi:polyhydroxybutyrate depolymerase